MITLLENINEIAVVLMLVSTVVYYRMLRKEHKQRGLSKTERIMLIVTSSAILLHVISYIMLYLGV